MFGALLAIIYVSFISLGLPDALLGAAWPVMQPQFGVPVSYMGAVTVIISLGTIIASLLSDRLTSRFGTGRVTACSVFATAAALIGFSCSDAYWQICLWAIPYGFGAGAVDAALNNYVAVHYASRHMSWLHCMWGVGASVGPYIMGFALTAGQGWRMGYLYVGVLQAILCAVLFMTMSKWHATAQQQEEQPHKVLSLKQIFAIPGAKAIMLTFFCYCAVEQTAGTWASSYFVMKDGLPAEEAASLGGVYYLGLTLGRFISGFVTMKLNDKSMVRLGAGIMAGGILMMLLPFGKAATVLGLLVLGLGSAPIYPCIIHSTPEHFGAENSQAVIGVQMAAAYVGILIMPPVFGALADITGMAALPVFLAVVLVIMIVMHERLQHNALRKQSAVNDIA